MLYSVSKGEIALLKVDRKGFSVEELLRDMEIHEGLMIANPKIKIDAN